MRKMILTATLGVLAVHAYAAGPTKEEAAARKELMARYTAISRAFEKKQMDTILDALLPDYTVSQPGGRVVTRDQVASDFQRQRDAMKSVTWKRNIDAVSLKDGAAIVTVSGKLSATVTDPQGKEHKMLFTAKSLDTWKRITDAQSAAPGKPAKSVWKLQDSVVLESHVEMDGRPAGMAGDPAGR